MEIWKPIKNYEGIYEISSIGRVRSIERTIYQYNPQLNKKIPVIYPKRYLKNDINKGYSRVCLSKNNKQKHFFIHQLVAEAFIPNPENKPFVDHINAIKTDNRVENLRWCTYTENAKFKEELKNNKFIAIAPDGKITEWYVIAECSRQLNLQIDGIWRCLKKQQKAYKGYKFQYCPPTE